MHPIVGSASSRRDFDRRFRPTSNRVRERWEQLALAQRRGAPIPPIDLYRVGDLHFVDDGHHRVSIAVATGQETIDAYVTEVLTAAPATDVTRSFGRPVQKHLPHSRLTPGRAAMRRLDEPRRRTAQVLGAGSRNSA